MGKLPYEEGTANQKQAQGHEADLTGVNGQKSLHTAHQNPPSKPLAKLIMSFERATNYLRKKDMKKKNR